MSKETQLSPTVVWPLTIFYDHSCQLCRTEILNLQLRDIHNKLIFVDVSKEENYLAWAMPASQLEMLKALHACDANGQWITGVTVFEVAYEAIELLWLSRLLQSPIIKPMAHKAYPLIVRLRSYCPKWLIWLLFGMPAKRAAQKAASKKGCDANDSCRL